MVNKSKKFKKNLFGEFFEENSLLCGIDEAGRGPIAGPLVVAGVILDNRIDGLNDSKKISPKRREELYEEIIKHRHHIVIINALKIDNDGISHCLARALEEIIDTLGAKGVNFLFDGNSCYGVNGINTMVKADMKVAEVSASSILAKVTRDRIMMEYAKEYPLYGFEKHKGYGTAKHIEAIRNYGFCPIHRKSFKIKKLSKIKEQKSLF